MKAINGRDCMLTDGLFLERERRNREYLMELTDAGLLQNYYQEAGLAQNFGAKAMPHHGWEDPSCQLRGHFLGHFLSACAMREWAEGDAELKAKADTIVHELARCQSENGGQWAASIPEKYFTWIARGKQVWAPHYTVHKTFMGLVDLYRLTGNREALEVADHFADWFLAYTDGRSREEMDDILDFETGGMLEIWADLLEATGDEKYRTLIGRYYRGRLFDPMLAGVDVLTNMHANTTIPEVLGCARVYEVTGEEKYRDIALAYWKQAVKSRPAFATGGQTLGEIWTPAITEEDMKAGRGLTKLSWPQEIVPGRRAVPGFSLEARLGDRNQEHCTVYNMMRLADFVFRQTGDKACLDYIERNLYNGILAQGHYRGGHLDGDKAPGEGLITYYLPLRAGARKNWASKFDDFFCCHGTLVQANAVHNRYLWYADGDRLYTGVYAESNVRFEVGGTTVTVEERRDPLSGSIQAAGDAASSQALSEEARRFAHHPDLRMYTFTVRTENPAEFTLCLRVPVWARGTVQAVLIGADGHAEPAGSAVVERNMLFAADRYRPVGDDGQWDGVKTRSNTGAVRGAAVEASANASQKDFITIRRVWKDGDRVNLMIPLAVYTIHLDGTTQMVAFGYGPCVLAGLSAEERALSLDRGTPAEELLTHDNEREWGSWNDSFKTRWQERGIRFVPLYQIGYERYQVYFPLIEKTPEYLRTPRNL